MPRNVQQAFIGYLAEELNIDPNASTKMHDDAYEGRYRKWQLETESLSLSKYLRADIPARDPYSAAEEFRTRYNFMKHVIYISRKSTGPTSKKSTHYTHRNTGRSPVQLQEFSVIVGGDAGVGEEITLTHLDRPSFPYQKLKNEFPRQRELMALFYDKCVVFRQLAASYSNALEAFANENVENVFRNLVVATELAFTRDAFGNIDAASSLRKNGARLLAMDWLRDQFQSLTFLTKYRSPSKSEGGNAWQIHLNILDDDKWNNYLATIQAPVILQWRRQQLMRVIDNSSVEMESLRSRFEAELMILWQARHQFAHRASVFREGYFVSLLLNFLRIVLDFRFSCYAIWLEWHSKRRIEVGEQSLGWDAYQFNFADGWQEEFGTRVSQIEPDFEAVRQDAGSMVKKLVLGAGYVGLGVLPHRKDPSRPLTV